MIDLRSDTVTKPTEEMRKAMYNAEVGDDVYRDDPTVINLKALGQRYLEKRRLYLYPVELLQTNLLF